MTFTVNVLLTCILNYDAGLILARFRSSPASGSLEQARQQLTVTMHCC